ncbi:MAG: saccharopine dehydrogenase NADP-binding domain-containing protein [Bacillota bacterium]|nr:saccharopine dehydrogenase NADP-binding domain-containing protein [Bacillota bacterium]
MNVLLVGTGGVGTAIARIVRKHDPESRWLQKMVLADYQEAAAKSLSQDLDQTERFPAVELNARDQEALVRIAAAHQIDLVLNACDPTLNPSIFNACFQGGFHYMDLAMTLSQRHPDHPYSKAHIKLGDEQYAAHEAWRQKGLTALVGSGADPGMANVFARYAEKHLFDEVEEVGVRDGGNLAVEGRRVSFGFSIWTTIEECLNPPLIWEKDRGWYTTEPFAEPEIFHFPEGIGDVELVHVEHEEVSMLPRQLGKGVRKITFKYGLGREFIQMLQYLQELNLDRKDLPVTIGDTTLSPRDFVARVAPNPAEQGSRMTGKTCVGTWVKGMKDGRTREVYLYQATDNQAAMAAIGSQAVVTQTAYPAVIMLELLARRIWQGQGVCPPESFDPDPFVTAMSTYGFTGGMMEMESSFARHLQQQALLQPLKQQ